MDEVREGETTAWAESAVEQSQEACPDAEEASRRVLTGRSESCVESELSCEPCETVSCESIMSTAANLSPSSQRSTSTSTLPTLLSQRTSVADVFQVFCGSRADMDGKTFAKLCKDCNFMDKCFSSVDADLLFARMSLGSHRRIDLNQFMAALDEIAKRKDVPVSHIHSAVSSSAGPVLNGTTKASLVRFHDDKSTWTGTHLNGGPEVGRKGTGCLPRRETTNISFGALADPTPSFATGLESRILQTSSKRPFSTKTVSACGGHMRIPSSSGDEGCIEDTFRFYSQNGEHMDGKSFVKLCKDCNLIGQDVSENAADLIFAKFKVRGHRHMNMTKFNSALRFLATKKGVDIETIFGNVASSTGPLLTGTKTQKVRFYDVRSLKSTIDTDNAAACGQSWRSSLRPDRKKEKLPRFVAQRLGDIPQAPEQLNARAIIDFQRERRRLRESVKKRPPLDTDETTMVFTDVQGSTSLWEANPQAMDKALRLHDSIMRQNMAKHDGYEVTTEGDAFQVAFHDAFDAVGFCLDVQMDLLSCDWPEETLQHPDACESPDGSWCGLRVRMGMHSGRPLPPTKHEMTGRTRYAGRSVAIAKAVEEMCHGGQILLSGDSFSQINGLLTQLQSPQVVDLGTHVLRTHGLADAANQADAEVRLLQLVPETLAHNHFSCPACSASGSLNCEGGRVFPPLSTKTQISPGFHASPAGSSVTLCFVFTKGARDLVASDPCLASHALGMLRHCVRELLTASGRSGYECQEDEGAFMLAFPNLSETAAFACSLQTELTRLAWQDELRACSPAFAQGLRVGIGALHGGYTSRGPHATTGRADYFGIIVNRTARIAQAAHAGQVLFGADASMYTSSKSKMQLPTGTGLDRLGAYAFKGIEGPLVVHELHVSKSDGQFEVFPEIKSKGRLGN